LVIRSPFGKNWIPIFKVLDDVLTQFDNRHRVLTLDGVAFQNSDDVLVAQEAKQSAIALPTKLLEPARAALVLVVLKRREPRKISCANRTTIILFQPLKILSSQRSVVRRL
jgi:hypothetical protein